MRLAKNLYSSPRVPDQCPSGGLNLLVLVQQARHFAQFHRLFGQATDLISLVRDMASKTGFALPDAAILEALSEIS